MNTINTQTHRFVMREGRKLAYSIAKQIDTFHNYDCFPMELGVKESNRSEIGDRDSTDGWEVITTLTFRFELGTVVRLEMVEDPDYPSGTVCHVEGLTIRYYDLSDNVSSPKRSEPKKQIRLEKSDTPEGVHQNIWIRQMLQENLEANVA